MTIYARCKNGVLTVHENANGKVRILDTDHTLGLPDFDWTEITYYDHNMKTGEILIEFVGVL